MFGDVVHILQFPSDVDPEPALPLPDEPANVDTLDLVTRVTAQQAGAGSGVVCWRIGLLHEEHLYPSTDPTNVTLAVHFGDQRIERISLEISGRLKTPSGRNVATNMPGCGLISS